MKFLLRFYQNSEYKCPHGRIPYAIFTKSAAYTLFQDALTGKYILDGFV